MENIVFFGKGGIGKSTIASNITAILASGGKKFCISAAILKWIPRFR